MSIFGLLSLGSQALLTNQKSVNITNENIANQYSDGYARQNVSLQDIVPEGVDIKRIERVFDNGLFKRYLNLNQEVSSDETYTNLLSEIETMFNDIQGTGFYKNVNKFFNSFSDVAINPDDPAARDAVISAANQLVAKIRDTYNNMTKVRDEISLSIKDNVNKVNNIIKHIAQLNKNIKAFKFDETRLNNYLNQRDALLKELSSYMDIKVVYRDDNTTDV
ncbi:flagellar hook-associated protein FlgK, partial [Hydrogenivirga sp. 128-5-R1-1]|uniref:flagellar hook-associated protein FlgK n=1 Tax=Hydrogenivirga sp. 128-5-R1-1 TaxID=392423 RepID=UPI00015F06C6